MFRPATIFASLLLVCFSAAFTARAEPSEAQLTKARQLIEIRGARKMYGALGSRIVDQLSNGAMDMIKQLGLPSKPVQKDVLQSLVREDFDKLFVPAAIEYAAHVYAEEFTDQELTDILAFYNSPSGRAYAEKETEALTRSTALMQQVMPPIWRDVLLRYCRQTDCPQTEYDRLEEATDPKPRGQPH
jgi:hypothetical protein